MKRGGRLNSWLRWAGWSTSDRDDELEEDELGIPGDSGESFKGLDGAIAVESRRSASFGLAKFGRFVERVDCVRIGGC